MLWQLPLLMLTQMLIHGLHTDMDMVLDIMDTVTTLDMEDIEDITDLMDMEDTGEEKRGMLMLWQLQLLMLTQMLIHGLHTDMDMVLDIMDMVTTLDMEDIEDITDLMDMDIWEGRRGMLML